MFSEEYIPLELGLSEVDSPVPFASLWVIQANAGTSKPAQDLLLANAAKRKIHIICLSEPHLYKGSISPTPGWKAVATPTAAILVNGAVTATTMEVIDQETVAAVFNDVTILSTYLSPNKPVSGILDALSHTLP